MNVYDWMKENEHPDAPPLNEPGTREDPGNRPHVPGDDDGTTRELHSNAGGGRVHEAEEHHVEHTIADPEQAVEETISNEGIVANVRKFFKVHNRGSQYVEMDGNQRADGVQLQKMLKDTYCNDAWLKDQTHRPGQVKVGDLADRINLDKIEQTVIETGAINAQFQSAQITAMAANMKLLKPALDKIKGKDLPDEAYIELKELAHNLSPSANNIKLPNKSKTNLITGKPTDEKREALSLEEVKSVAAAVLKALDESHAIWNDGGDTIDSIAPGYPGLYFAVLQNKASSKTYNNQAWQDLMATLHRKLFSGSPDVMQAYRTFENACIAAVTYMERSFTGSKVSNEEFTISNEGIVDKIMKLFTPGKDKDIYKSVDAVSVNVLAKELKEKYANPTWVKRQGVKEGMVSVSAANLVDKKYDAEINEHITALKAERSRLDKTLPSALKALGELISFLPTMTSDKDLAKARELLTKAQEFDRLKFQKQRDSSKPGEVPALTEAEVVSKTRALLAVFEQTEVTSNYRSEFERVVKSSTPGANWYRNWQYVESKSRNGLVAKLNGKVSSEKLNTFLDTYERALTWISANVPGVADLRPIQAHIRARFEQIEKSVK